MSYHIISVKRSKGHFVFWKDNNNGYTLEKDNVGVYHKIEQGYHNGLDTIAVDKKTADLLWEKTRDEETRRRVVRIANNANNRTALGLDLDKRGRLVRRRSKTFQAV